MCASYHPVGSYRFLVGDNVKAEPSAADSDAPMGSLSDESAISSQLGLLNTLLPDPEAGW